jgi:hypothetical protein
MAEETKKQPKSWDQIQKEVVEEMENPEKLIKLMETDKEAFEKIGLIIGLMTMKMENDSIQPVEFLYRVCHKCYELGKESADKMSGGKDD